MQPEESVNVEKVPIGELAEGASEDDRPPERITQFTAFYRAATPRLVTFLLWQGASLPDATDCAQEALSQAFAKWVSIEHPQAWCRMVASRAYGHRIAAVQREVSVTAGLAPLLPTDTADIDNYLAESVILSALRMLPPRQRQVVAWIYHGASVSETAEALGMTPSAVGSNLHKARRKLSELLSEDDDK